MSARASGKVNILFTEKLDSRKNISKKSKIFFLWNKVSQHKKQLAGKLYECQKLWRMKTCLSFRNSKAFTQFPLDWTIFSNHPTHISWRHINMGEANKTHVRNILRLWKFHPKVIFELLKLPLKSFRVISAKNGRYCSRNVFSYWEQQSRGMRSHILSMITKRENVKKDLKYRWNFCSKIL